MISSATGIYHPNLPKINLEGRVWFDTQSRQRMSLDEVETHVEKAPPEECEQVAMAVHVFGFPDFTYYKVFCHDHDRLRIGCPD